MFAIVVERNPLTLSEVPLSILSWVEVVGAIALVGMIFMGLARLVGGRSARGLSPAGLRELNQGKSAFVATLVLSLVCYLVGGAMVMIYPSRPRLLSPALIHGMLAAGGAFALVGVLAPIIATLLRASPRRIWALTRLSFQEALRRRVLVAFSIILVAFLFAGWFLPAKPEYQLKTYVWFVYFVTAVFLLLISGILASFGIPTDLKTQTMDTIVTKPVERFEIVLGRCIGYVVLMTIVLVFMSAFSLTYVARGIDEDAKVESYKARVPIFGILEVKEAKSVGREWDYRKYIAGGATKDEAIWRFAGLPSHVGKPGAETVPCEFSFDIFRTYKGKEGRGVRCSFRFTNWKWDDKDEPRYKAALADLQSHLDPAVIDRAEREGWPQDVKQAVLRDKLAEQFGIYELHSKEISDYHTLAVAVPAGLFKGLADHKPGADGNDLRIHVRCEDPSQYLGVARHDLYVLDDEQSFAANFFKGAIGLWCRLVLVIVVAVTLSTYFSGIISFLTTAVLYLASMGFLRDFIQEIASRKLVGGGPFESAIRLFRGANLLTPLEEGATKNLGQAGDVVYSYFMRLFLFIVPDVDRFDLTRYVAEGFDVTYGQLLTDNLIPLAGYVIPWIVLAYYLMRSREVASS